MATLSDFITEIATGEYGQDIVNYGKDSNGDFQPFNVDINGNQYVIDEATATKLDTLIAKDFATETTLDTRLSSLETKMDTLLNSQDATTNNLNVQQNGSNVEEQFLATSVGAGATVDLSTGLIENFKKISFTCKETSENPHDFTLRVRYGVGSGDLIGWNATKTENNVNDFINNILGQDITENTSYVSFSIINNDTSTHEYNAYLHKFK